MPPRLFLIDGYALIYRAFFAMISRPLRTSKGENTSAAWGVANFLLRLREKYRPDYVAWINDAGTSFREERYPEYKSTREKLDDELQADFDRAVERIRALLDAFRIPMVTVPGYEAEIRTPEGNEVEPGETGRLWMKGDSAAAYYWNKPEKTAETMVDGWLNTGDTYREDEDGYFIYEGRSDDMLKVGGIWCSPVEIEACLIGHPAVLEAAVIGQADADDLVKPKACVVLKDAGGGSEALTAELAARCKQTLAPYKYPRWIEYVSELPKTATGKIQRFKLRG